MTLSRPLRILAAVIVFIVCFLIAKTIIASKETVEAAPPTERSWRVHSVEAKLDSLSPTIDLYGTVTTSSQATLTSAILADVSKVSARAGDAVSNLQTLIQLDDREARITELQALAQYHEAAAALSVEEAAQATERSTLQQEQAVMNRAEESLERIKGLHKRGLASQANLDSAKDALTRAEQTFNRRDLAVQQQDAKLKSRTASVSKAKAALERTTLDRKRAKVKAPFDAYVVNVAVAAGDRVSPGQPLATVYARDDIEVKAQIPNRHLPIVRLATNAAGQAGRGHLGLQAYILNNDTPIANARLKRLARNAGAASGGVDAWFEMDEHSLELGRHVQLRLLLPKVGGVIAINSDTLYGLNHIFKIDSEDRLKRIEVEVLGNWYDANGKQMILVKPKGLANGESVLAVQLPNAATGMLVTTGTPKTKAEKPAQIRGDSLAADQPITSPATSAGE
jgi:multidrug efflux pump subunit AcrA (membrane-fusion protein)